MTNTISTVHQMIPIRAERFINERYPTRSRLNLCFPTQRVTLTEIYETDEENQQESQAKIYTNYDRFGRVENIRRITRKHFHQQKLPTTQEELCETDSN